MVKLSIRKGDKVKVITGKEKGKSGKVLKTIPSKERVVVEGLHMIKVASKKTQTNQQGGIVDREGTVQVSNVAIVGPTCDGPAKTKSRRTEDGQRVRYCGRCDTDLDKE